MIDNAVRDVFLEESKELLDTLDSDIVRLETSPDQDVMNRVFRSVHTLKGGSGIAGYDQVYEFTHGLENLLDLVRKGETQINAAMITLLLRSLDWIRQAVAAADGEECDIAVKEALQRDINACIGEVSAVKAGGTHDEKPRIIVPGKTDAHGNRYYHIRCAFNEDIFLRGIDPLMIMEDLRRLGTFIQRKINKKDVPNFDSLDPEKCYFSWEVVLKTEHTIEKVYEVFLFVHDDNDIVIRDITENYDPDSADARIAEKRIGEILLGKGVITENELNDVLNEQDQKNAKLGDLVVSKGYATEKDVEHALVDQEKIKKKIETGTVRVDTAKLDNLLNLLGEIVIGQSAISRLADDMSEEQSFMLKNALYGMERTTREFQEQLMSIRMIPIGPSFEQFRRFVRDVSHSLNKEIYLEIEGQDTELDKTVIERISDPLKHMIRNAIDHGIESPETRAGAGKPKSGKITLRAYHQEGNVFIEVSDDGGGIDRKEVRAKAEALGLVKHGEEIADAKLLQFLFLPGFSTTSQVGELSGRGVGMDVVKNNIESLRGSVEIETREKIGTTFRVKLPLTLAIIEGMLIRVGKSIFILPMLSIVESIRPRKEDVQTVEKKGELIRVRGEYAPLVRLYEIFGIESEHHNPWESLVVIVESAGVRLGIMIDELVGQQQIVIKSLDTAITNSRSVSGAAILGNGQVALILDVHGLLSEIMS